MVKCNGKRELAPNFTQTKESGRGGNGNNNGGKNFKRKKNNRLTDLNFRNYVTTEKNKIQKTAER